ncbi:Lipase 5 [Vermiconidia calcicola]|uniref:Lipase 5 n=1 Tax=Vermiconidia calcicola TaxID=1690605 RepID=A0ACC3MRX0_9PEZI|nr:Lipase 5 [Vermiconidia calcicola]
MDFLYAQTSTPRGCRGRSECGHSHSAPDGEHKKHASDAGSLGVKTQRRRGMLRCVLTVALRNKCLPIDAVVYAKHLASHPLQSLGKATYAAFHPINTVVELAESVLDQVYQDSSHLRDGSRHARDREDGSQHRKSDEALREDNCLFETLRETLPILRRDLGEICKHPPSRFLGNDADAAIADYQATVLNMLNYIVASVRDVDRLERERTRDMLLRAKASFGQTALLCSGGGTHGMAHIGVLKALSKAGRLPRIICGSSAGAIVCAVLCTRTDEELPKILDEFLHGDLAVFVAEHESNNLLARLLHFARYGCLFDNENLKRVVKGHLKQMTFTEAYNKTGRVLNITVSGYDEERKAYFHRILNHVNSGDALIWSAVVASCAIPLGYKAGKLEYKRTDTELYMAEDQSTPHLDGSVAGDIPLKTIKTEFNAKYVIASQANPHVTLFARAGDLVIDTFGDGALHSLCGSSFAFGKTLAQLVCRSGHMVPFLDYYAKLGSSVLDQRYTGDITIYPKWDLARYWACLSNPTPEFLREAQRLGEQAALPLVPMIKNHLKIEHALDLAYVKAEDACRFSDSESDLRRLEIELRNRAKRRRNSSNASARSEDSPIDRETLLRNLSFNAMSLTPLGTLGSEVEESPFQDSSPPLSASSEPVFIIGPDIDNETDDGHPDHEASKDYAKSTDPARSAQAHLDIGLTPVSPRSHPAPRSLARSTSRILGATISPPSLMMTPTSVDLQAGRIPRSDSAVQRTAPTERPIAMPSPARSTQPRVVKTPGKLQQRLNHRRASSTGFLGLRR